MKKVLLVDAFGIIFRSYYAFISRPLTNKNGENISAVFGFFKSILSILKTQKPDEILIALEGKGECFRNEIYPQYKANRSETPDDLKSQIVKIIDLIDKFSIPHFFKSGFEADDIIGTLTEVFSKQSDSEVIIFSSDKDLRQLVKNNATLCRPDPKSQNNIFYDRDRIFEEMGIYPEQVADYLALTGDSSDNIPGVPGIGDKSATALLKEWGTLDNIYNNIDAITPAGVKKKIAENRDLAYLSKRLTAIKCDIELDINENELTVKPFTIDNAISILKDDGMNSLIEEIKNYNMTRFGSKTIENETPVMPASNVDSSAFIFVDTIIKCNSLCDLIKKHKAFSFDLETTGFDFFNDEIICMSVTLPDEKTFVIPFNFSDNAGKVPEIITMLMPVFADETIIKIGHNVKFDIKFLRVYGIKIITTVYDTMLAEYCIDSGNTSLGLKNLGEKYFDISMIKYEELLKEAKTKDLNGIPVEKLITYAGQDSLITYKLFMKQHDDFKSNPKAYKLYITIEQPLIEILCDMEFIGVLIDEKHLHILSAKMDEEITKLYQQMSEMTGEIFNPNSPLQLRDILFDKFGLPVLKKNKTGPSTDVDVLNKLALMHPFPKLLLEYRTYSKIKSTYSDPLPKLVNAKTGKIHTTYLQTGTQTGRMSCKDPNLQNIPIRNKVGREIRKSFIPSKGNILISADYSQIEIFLLAEFSKDVIMTEAILNNVDIHARTASILFNKYMNEITKEERNIAKTVNFGILYGQSGFSLAEDINVSRVAANDFIKKYFENFKGVEKFIEELKTKCHEKGYAETFWGRIRTIPEINDKNKMIKANAERMAVNTVIQGTAADLIKLAMIKIYASLKKSHCKTKLILQVHDELIFDAPENELAQVTEIIKQCMENDFGFSLKLKTSIEHGNTWGDLH